MIRLAAAADLDAVAAIYEEVLAAEEGRERSYTNWQRGKYPTRRHAQAALEAGSLYVAEEAEGPCACFILNQEQLPEYARIPWTIPAAPEEVAVIHTLCVSPRWSGRGKARELVAFCEGEGRRLGARAMRLDTYVGNDPANAMYPRLGYTLAGKTMFHFQNFIWEELNCYEKALFPERL